MHHIRTAIAIALPLALFADPAAAARYGDWKDPAAVTAVNTPAAAEGCPIEGPDGLSLYIASNRSAPGAQGSLDIYRATRRTLASGWHVPGNLGAPVNTAAAEYCPTPLPGKWLMFVSARQDAEDCYPGNGVPPGSPPAGDIYLTREHPVRGWEAPAHLGCVPHGPNTAGAEFSPSLVETAAGTFLFFSSNGYGNSQKQDIYMSRVLADGRVLPGVRVAELSTPYDDLMPNVRKDGLEIVFSSNRASSDPFNQDIYVARRSSPYAQWSAPQRIDNRFINTPGSETRASLSRDGTRLYFGRKTSPTDPGDVFVSRRDAR